MILGLSLINFLLIIALFCVATFLLRKKRQRRGNLPPGPTPLPLIGNILQLDKDIFYTISKWTKIYGPIFRVKVGMTETIVLNDHKLVRELFSDNASSGRSTNPLITQGTNGSYGVVNTEGPTWQVHRRFTLRTLRDLGFAKNSMETMIMEEVRAVLHLFAQKEGVPMSGNRIFNAPVVNALWHIVAGKRFEWESGEKPELFQVADQFFESITGVSSLLFAPQLRYLAPEWTGWTKYVRANAHFRKLFEEAITEHKAELDPSNPQDFIDHTLKEINSTTDPSSIFYEAEGHKNLIASLFELFMAGSETSSNTLSWSMLYLANSPEVQRKLQEEIDVVIGTWRSPSVADRPKMPYMEAVLSETLRMSTVTPGGVPHKMMEDRELHGYLLPKNSVIVVYQFGIHSNPQVWGDPDNFRPERFLSEDGTKCNRHEALIPFSVGKRSCLGEGLARDTHFLFVTSIFQRFNITFDPAHNNPEFKSSEGMLRCPSPFKFIATPRKM